MKTQMRSWMKLVSGVLVVAFAITLLAPAGKGFVAYAEEPTAQVAAQTEEEQKTEEQKAQEEKEAAEQARAKKWKKILVGGLVVGGVLVVLAAAGNTGNNGSVVTSNVIKTTLSGNSLTVVDNEACSINITGIETNAILGNCVAVKLKNKSSDTDYRFWLTGASINGVQVTNLWAKDVGAGNEAYESIPFYLSAEQTKQIGTFKEIKLSFRVFNYNNLTESDVANVTVTYYPYGV